MGTPSCRTVQIGEVRCSVCVEEKIHQERIETFFPFRSRVQGIDLNNVRIFKTLEKAAMVAAQEIFYISTINEAELDNLREKGYALKGNFGDYWGNGREYGISIYKKTEQYRLSWRRHGTRKNIRADTDLGGFGECVGFVHSHGGINNEVDLNDEESKFSHADLLNAGKSSKKQRELACYLVHVMEDNSNADSQYSIHCGKKNVVGVLQAFIPHDDGMRDFRERVIRVGAANEDGLRAIRDDMYRAYRESITITNMSTLSKGTLVIDTDKKTQKLKISWDFT